MGRLRPTTTTSTNTTPRLQRREWTEFHFIWNMKTPYFSDKRVRQAMSYAFDYDEMLEHDLPRPVSSQVAARFIPRLGAFPRTAPQPYKQDLDKAEDLLDEAGWTDSDGDGIRDKEINGRRVPFEFTLMTFQIGNRHPDALR